MTDYQAGKDVVTLQIRQEQVEQRVRRLEEYIFSDTETNNENEANTKETTGQEHR
jgi:hypothetical protein